MADNISKKARSSLIGKIKSKEAKLEKNVWKALSDKDIRYRKNSYKHFGKPDIVISSRKTVIFIDSCFWHGCKKHCRMPEASHNYWVDKIKRNKRRNKDVNKYYKKMEWKIIRVWEHNVKNFSYNLIKEIR